MKKEMIMKASTKELNVRLDELSAVLNRSMGDEWDIAYDEYCLINDVLDERYRDENMQSFEDYFAKNIEGKTWEEVRGETFDFYSDWHKDMFGYRPKTLKKDW